MKFLIPILLMFFCQYASAEEYLFAPHIHYSSVTNNDNGTTSDSSLTVYDIYMGYTQESGLHLGLLYSTLDQGDSSLTSTPTQNALALNLGYRKEGWVVYAGYVLQSTWTVSNTTKRTSGSGIILNFGYQWEITPTFRIGPALRYSSLNWTQQTVSGVDSEIDYTQSRIMPQFGMSFVF